MANNPGDDFNYTSETEWDAASASEIGALRRNQPWILSDRDVWYANPHYSGPPQRHPEDDNGYESDEVGEIEDDFSEIPF